MRQSEPAYSAADLGVASVAIVVYAVLVVTLLPSSDFARMLGGAAFLITVVAIVTNATRKSESAMSYILIVSFVGVAILVVPGFKAMGGQNGSALPIGFLGSQTVSLLWATLTWREASRPRDRILLRDALRFALLGAAFLSVIASIPIVLMLFSRPIAAGPFLLVYPAYFIGALAAAVIYWSLNRIAHRPLGLYVIGGLGGTCMYTAVAPIVFLTEAKPIRIGELVGLGLVCGFLAGPPVAISISDERS